MPAPWAAQIPMAPVCRSRRSDIPTAWPTRLARKRIAHASSIQAGVGERIDIFARCRHQCGQYPCRHGIFDRLAIGDHAGRAASPPARHSTARAARRRRCSTASTPMKRWRISTYPDRPSPQARSQAADRCPPSARCAPRHVIVAPTQSPSPPARLARPLHS